jgi:preprotein translocase subunit SecE
MVLYITFNTMKKIRGFISGIKSKYKKFATTYPKLDSAIHTFISAFSTAVVVVVGTIPHDQLLSPSTWTTSFIFALITTGIRSGFRAITTK